MPFWTKKDLHQFLQKHLCDKCRRNGVQSIASACTLCAMPPRRGRPSTRAAVAATTRVLQDSKAADAMGAAAFSRAPTMFLTSNPTSARHVHVQQAATFIAYKPTTPAVCHVCLHSLRQTNPAPECGSLICHPSLPCQSPISFLLFPDGLSEGDRVNEEASSIDLQI
jgi:hypothetical protein